MAGDEFGYDPTMMGAWNEAPPRYERSPAAEKRAARWAAEQAAFNERSRAEARERASRRIGLDCEICAYCGESSRHCECWS